MEAFLLQPWARTLFFLFFMALLLGPAMFALQAAYILFVNRKRSRSFLVLANWFGMSTVYAVVLFMALSQIPEESKDLAYRILLVAALVLWAAGLWPATMHFTLLIRKTELAEKAQAEQTLPGPPPAPEQLPWAEPPVPPQEPAEKEPEL